MFHTAGFANGREIMALVSGRRELDRTLGDLTSHDFRPEDIHVVAAGESLRRFAVDRGAKASGPDGREAAERLADISRQRLAENLTLLVGLIAFFSAGTGAAMTASSATWAPVVAAAAVGGTIGVVFGSMVALAIRVRHLRQLRTKLADGKALVGIRVDGPAREREATDVLQNHTRETLHVHATGGSATSRRFDAGAS